MQRDSQFGPFRIVRRLGVGGMAETFVAERRGPAGFEQRVCLKRVLPAFCEDPSFVAMFQNEARVAARLSHPHIAQIYDFGEADRQWWMTLELIDGIDLRALLDAVRNLGQPMPLDLVLLIVADVCAALAYAHEPSRDGRPGIVHRDVSPSNVLLSYDGAVKLADFGIAKPASGDHATASGIKGKVPYMSPEQALGGAVDGRSDLFSLGVMAYEMLADRRPFDGPTELATLSNLVAGARPRLVDLAPHAPAHLVDLVERLITPDRKGRPASASDVLDALSSSSPPLSSRRVLGQLVRRVRPPDAASPPVDATGPTVPTPSAAGAATTAPSQRPPAAYTAHNPSPAPVGPPAAETATAPEARASTPVAFTGPSPDAASRSPAISSRKPLVALGGVALVAVLAVAGAATLVGLGNATLVGLGDAPQSASPSADPAPALPSPAVRPPHPLPSPALATAPPSPPSDGSTARLAASPVALLPDAPHLPLPAAPTTRGTLVVTAYPWGFVEIDGRPFGRSPVRTDLPAGDHSVLVRADAIVRRRTVTVTAGRRRELVVPVE